MSHPSRSATKTTISMVGHLLLGASAISLAAESGDVRSRVAILISALELRSTFISIHAAESLITLGHPGPARNAFLPQAETTEPKYRIGVWRVLARTAATPQERRSFVNRIRQVILQKDAQDTVHAIESMAKLGEPLTAAEADFARTFALDSTASGAPYALWCLANSGDEASLEKLPELIGSESPAVRAQAAYSLWQMGKVDEEVRARLQRQLNVEPENSAARPVLIAAIGGPAVLELARSAALPSARYLAGMALAEAPELADEQILAALIQDEDADVRVAGAFAWLCKHPPKLEQSRGDPK